MQQNSYPKTKRLRQEPVTQFSSNVTLLLDAEIKTEVVNAYSVRIRPQGPDYRCFVLEGYKGCEVVRHGRARSMGIGKELLMRMV